VTILTLKKWVEVEIILLDIDNVIGGEFVWMFFDFKCQSLDFAEM